MGRLGLFRTTLCVAAVIAASATPLQLVSIQPEPTSDYTRTVSYQGQYLLRCQGARRDFNHWRSLDVWAIRPNGTVDIRVTNEEDLATVTKSFDSCDAGLDVEAMVQEFEAAHLKARNSSADWFGQYHNYRELVDWYKSKADGQLMKFTPSIGKSVEGRDIPVVVITGTKSKKVPKQKVYFQCLVHAREWISGAVCNFMVDSILESYGKDSAVTELFDRIELHLVPVANPDGYEYTWSNERLWRKNRRKNSLCYGVDVNRNYDDHWNQGGSSDDPCSDTYHGKSAASEPETQTTMAYFKKIAPVIAGVDWHAYSELILRPYGFSTATPPHDRNLRTVGNGMREAALKVHGVNYTDIASVELYPTSGSASDWFFGSATKTNQGVQAYGFTLELRDTGRYGFELPPEQIRPNGEEMLAAALYFLEYVADHPLKA